MPNKIYKSKVSSQSLAARGLPVPVPIAKKVVQKKRKVVRKQADDQPAHLQYLYSSTSDVDKITSMNNCIERCTSLLNEIGSSSKNQGFASEQTSQKRQKSVKIISPNSKKTKPSFNKRLVCSTPAEYCMDSTEEVVDLLKDKNTQQQLLQEREKLKQHLRSLEESKQRINSEYESIMKDELSHKAEEELPADKETSNHTNDDETHSILQSLVQSITQKLTLSSQTPDNIQGSANNIENNISSKNEDQSSSKQQNVTNNKSMTENGNLYLSRPNHTAGLSTSVQLGSENNNAEDVEDTLAFNFSPKKSNHLPQNTSQLLHCVEGRESEQPPFQQNTQQATSPQNNVNTRLFFNPIPEGLSLKSNIVSMSSPPDRGMPERNSPFEKYSSPRSLTQKKLMQSSQPKRKSPFQNVSNVINSPQISPKRKSSSRKSPTRKSPLGNITNSNPPQLSPKKKSPLQNVTNSNSRQQSLGSRSPSDQANNAVDARTIQCPNTQVTTLSYLMKELRNVLADKCDLQVDGLLEEIIHIVDLLPFFVNNNNKRDADDTLKEALQPLQLENAALRRKLRIASQTIKKSQNVANQVQEKEDLVSRLKDEIEAMRLQLEDTETNKERLSHKIQEVCLTSEELRRGNESLQAKLSQKEKEIAAERNSWVQKVSAFNQESSERECLMRDYERLMQASMKEKSILRLSIEQRDNEIQRLKQLTSDLQQSVTNLLADIQEARETKPVNNLPNRMKLPNNCMAAAPGGKIPNTFKGEFKRTPRKDTAKGNVTPLHERAKNISPVHRTRVSSDRTQDSYASTSSFVSQLKPHECSEFRQDLSRLDEQIKRIQQSLAANNSR